MPSILEWAGPMRRTSPRLNFSPRLDFTFKAQCILFTMFALFCLNLYLDSFVWLRNLLRIDSNSFLCAKLFSLIRVSGIVFAVESGFPAGTAFLRWPYWCFINCARSNFLFFIAQARILLARIQNFVDYYCARARSTVAHSEPY